MSRTTDADCGGTSKAKAYGSLFFSTAPPGVRISNLYFSPSGRLGMKSSQTPLGVSRRIGCTRPSHPLKSPITLTRSAFGAHTAKWTQLAGGHQAELDRSRLGLKRANHRAAAAFVAMRPEQRKRIAVARFDEQPNRAGRRRFGVVIDRSHFSEDSKPGTAT